MILIRLGMCKLEVLSTLVLAGTDTLLLTFSNPLSPVVVEILEVSQVGRFSYIEEALIKDELYGFHSIKLKNNPNYTILYRTLVNTSKFLGTPDRFITAYLVDTLSSGAVLDDALALALEDDKRSNLVSEALI